MWDEPLQWLVTALKVDLSLLPLSIWAVELTLTVFSILVFLYRRVLLHPHDRHHQTHLPLLVLSYLPLPNHDQTLHHGRNHLRCGEQPHALVSHHLLL